MMQLAPINSMFLEPIIIKAMDCEEGYGWTKEYALQVSEEYLKFLQLCFDNPDESIVPSSIVDDFWHLHILDTQKYQEDCIKHFGYFLHHFPYFGMRSEEDEKNLKVAWETTKSIYKDRYGSLPDHLWPNSNRCPKCGRRCRKMTITSEERPTFNSLGL